MNIHGLKLHVDAAERLAIAHAIIDGIPKKNIFIGKWARNPKEKNMKQMVRCPGVWLLMHPSLSPFVGESRYLQWLDDGMKGKNEGWEYVPVLKKNRVRYFGSLILADLLGISPQEAAHLFKQPTRLESEKRISDKEVWLARLKNLHTKVQRAQAKNPHFQQSGELTHVKYGNNPSNDSYSLAA